MAKQPATPRETSKIRQNATSTNGLLLSFNCALLQKAFRLPLQDGNIGTFQNTF